MIDQPMTSSQPAKKRRLGRYDKTVKASETIQKKSSLKNRIRSLKRLIKSKRLNEETLREKQRMLKSLQARLPVGEDSTENTQRIERERKRATRYHKVKFFERQKLVRKLKTLQKADKAQSEEFNKLADNLRYVLFFPKAEKYISIIKAVKETELTKQQQLREKALEEAKKQHFDIISFLDEQYKPSNNSKSRKTKELVISENETSFEEDEDFTHKANASRKSDFFL